MVLHLGNDPSGTITATRATTSALSLGVYYSMNLLLENGVEPFFWECQRATLLH